MATPSDEVHTYPVTDVSKAYQVPVDAIAVEFITTTPIWVTGGLTEGTTVAASHADNNVYILANTALIIHFDQAVTPWFAIKSHIGGTRGFVTAIWHKKGDPFFNFQ